MEERAVQLPVHGYVYSQSGITNCEHGIVPGMYTGIFKSHTCTLATGIHDL